MSNTVVMNRIFNRAYRKLGKEQVKSRTRNGHFTIKAMGLAGKKVEEIDIKVAYKAVDELVEAWHKDDSLNVVLTISAKKGVRIKDQKGAALFSYKIYNVAYCTVSDSNPEIFLFIARGPDSTTSCHAFYCRDEFLAKEICFSMSNAFRKALEIWMERNGTPYNTLSECKRENNQCGDVVLGGDFIGNQCSTGTENLLHTAEVISEEMEKAEDRVF